MPELDEHHATRIVHSVGHQFPSRDLLGCLDAQNLNILLSLGGPERSFADDKTSACSLAIIECRFSVGDVVRATGASHRRHDETISKSIVTQFVGFKKFFHGFTIS